MNNYGEIYDRVEGVVAKLHVLRSSCASILHIDKSDPSSIWLHGAEVMLKEAVEELQTALKTRAYRR